MPMTRALTVQFALTRPMTEETLIQVREELSLHRMGRLTDTMDAEFGYRYLQKDDQNWISFDLYRDEDDDTIWAFYLTYLKAPPAPEIVDQLLADITTTAKRHGFTITEIKRRPAPGQTGNGPPDGLPERPEPTA